MGLFRRAGRTVEQLKQSVEEAAADEATHGCTDCDERFYTPQDRCPECGGSVQALADGG